MCGIAMRGTVQGHPHGAAGKAATRHGDFTMHTTMMKGVAIALLAAAMSMAGDASAHSPPTTPCTEANAWEIVTMQIPPYDGWDQVQYMCVPGYGWYFSAYCNSVSGFCFYY
jgi:hypothetical protein